MYSISIKFSIGLLLYSAFNDYEVISLKSNMSKVKTVYRCEQCGADHLKWAGQCSECGEWNCLNEVKLEPTTAHRARPKVGVMRVKSPILQRLIKSLFLMKPVYQQALANLTVCLVVAW